MGRNRRVTYREAETLPGEEMRERLIEWRRQQNLVVHGLLEYWRKASPAQRQGLPWYVETDEGSHPVGIRGRDGELLARIARVPSGEPVLVWAVSAGVLDDIEKTLRELQQG